MRILIVDDSAVIRAILEQNLKEMGHEISDSVSTGRKAVDRAERNPPDVVLSDIDMPEMDGFEATRILAGERKIPVILFGDDESLSMKAKSAGASDFLVKPRLDSYNREFFDMLSARMDAICKKSGRKARGSKTNAADRNSAEISGTRRDFRILCIGASTGGPTAVSEVLNGLGRNFPLPIIYSQHIEVGADLKMCEWFNTACPNVPVRLARDGEEALAGTVYMAPADRHLVIDFLKSSGRPVLKISDDPPWRFLRPAVNKMFESAAHFYRKGCLAVLLTGMGRDGADGCRAIVDAGGHTIVEDESTCAVFGMPAAAIEAGGADEVLPRGQIAPRILNLISGGGV